MVKNKKITRGTPLKFKRLAGLALGAAAGLTIIFSVSSPVALANAFGGSSARNGGTDAYIENNAFGTSRESGPAFQTDPATGERRFQTPAPPKKEEPEGIEVLPVRPEVRPTVPPAKDPIVIQPGGAGSP